MFPKNLLSQSPRVNKSAKLHAQDSWFSPPQHYLPSTISFSLVWFSHIDCRAWKSLKGINVEDDGRNFIRFHCYCHTIYDSRGCRCMHGLKGNYSPWSLLALFFFCSYQQKKFSWIKKKTIRFEPKSHWVASHCFSSLAGDIHSTS